MVIYDMVSHLIPKLRNKSFSKNKKFRTHDAKLDFIVKSNWIFSKLYLLIYIYIWLINFNCFKLYKKKKLINIKSFKISLPQILYIELDIWLGFYGLFILDFLTRNLKLRLDGTH